MSVGVMLAVNGFFEGARSLHVYFGNRWLIQDSNSALPLGRRCCRRNASKALLSYYLWLTFEQFAVHLAAVYGLSIRTSTRRPRGPSTGQRHEACRHISNHLRCCWLTKLRWFLNSIQKWLPPAFAQRILSWYIPELLGKSIFVSKYVFAYHSFWLCCKWFHNFQINRYCYVYK